MVGVEEQERVGNADVRKERSDDDGMEAAVTAYRCFPVVVPRPQSWLHIFSFTIFLLYFLPLDFLVL